MSINIVLGKNLPCEQVIGLYQAEGWVSGNPGVEFAEKMLAGSFEVAAAVDGAVLCGMMRALSDGVSDAYLLDLVVARQYRCQGIGRQLVHALSQSMLQRGIDWVVCIGAPGTEKFYEHSGVKKMTGFVPYRFL